MSNESVTFGTTILHAENREILEGFLDCHELLTQDWYYTIHFHRDQPHWMNENELVLNLSGLGRHSFGNNCHAYASWLNASIADLDEAEKAIFLEKAQLLEGSVIEIIVDYTDEESNQLLLEIGIIKIALQLKNGKFHSTVKQLQEQTYEYTAQNLVKYCDYDYCFDNSADSLYQLLTQKGNDPIRRELPYLPNLTYQQAEWLAEQLDEVLTDTVYFDSDWLKQNRNGKTIVTLIKELIKQLKK